MGDILPIFIAGLLAFLAFCAYLLPAIIANGREHNDRNAIFLLNLIFGWTFLGWGVALIWSFTGNVKLKRSQPIGETA